MCLEGNNQEKHERQELAAWHRLVAACNQEKRWMHERSGTFLTAQGFLLAAFGVTLSAHVLISPLFLLFVHIVLCVIGCLTSFSALCSVGAAAWMHRLWSQRLHNLVSSSNYIKAENYFTYGCCGQWPDAMARLAPLVCPAILTLCWLVLLCVSILFRLT